MGNRLSPNTPSLPYATDAREGARHLLKLAQQRDPRVTPTQMALHPGGQLSGHGPPSSQATPDDGLWVADVSTPIG